MSNFLAISSSLVLVLVCFVGVIWFLKAYPLIENNYKAKKDGSFDQHSRNKKERRMI